MGAIGRLVVFSFLAVLISSNSYVSAAGNILADKSAVMYDYQEWAINNVAFSGNAFDVVATATFTHASGEAEPITTEMFYSGGNTWKFRFTPIKQGTWDVVTNSSNSDLNGYTGSVTVLANSDKSKKGFLTSQGNKFAIMGGDNGELKGFLLNIFETDTGLDGVPDSFTTFAYFSFFINNTETKINQYLDYAKARGFNSVKIQLNNNLFSSGAERYDEHSSNSPDLLAFDVLDTMITAAHAKGMRMYFWRWGDEQRKWTPVGLAGGINGEVDTRLTRYFAARLAPLAGWNMGYGFDLQEWVNTTELEKWKDDFLGYMGQKHLLSARGTALTGNNVVHGYSQAGNFPGLVASDIPTYDELVVLIAQNTTIPHLLEERNALGRWDLDSDGTRKLMWNTAMAGGVGGVYGYFAFFAGDDPVFGGGSGYTNPDALMTHHTFWENRFLLGLDVQNSLSQNTKILQTSDNQHFILYVENAASIDIDLSGMSIPQPVVAVDSKKPYSEVSLGDVDASDQIITLPYSSDWAIAVGNFDDAIQPPLPLTFEAEDGQLSGTFVVGNDANASGGKYVHVPEGTGNGTPGSADYTFTITTAGTYRIDANVYADGGTNDSFWVKMDGQPVNGFPWWTQWNTSYALDQVSDHDTGLDPYLFDLSEGEHTLSFTNREDGTRLDRLELVLVGATPVATGGKFSVDKGTTHTGILQATDADGDSLTYSIVGTASYGVVTVTDVATGAFNYTPDTGYSGPDSFTFKANDGALDSNIASMSVTVTGINSEPVATSGDFSVDKGATHIGILQATDPDGDALTYSIVATASHGGVTITDSATGAFTYQPVAGFTGKDSFTFKTNDGVSDSNIATMSVTVTDDDPIDWDKVINEATGEHHLVTSVEEFNSILPGLKPGDVVTIKDGTYSNLDMTIPAGVSGTEEQPIIITSESRRTASGESSRVKLTGGSRIWLRGNNHMIIGGFDLNGIQRQDSVVLFRNSSHNRFTDNHFTDCGHPDKPNGRIMVLGEGSNHNRMDHNIMRGNISFGMVIHLPLDRDIDNQTASVSDYSQYNRFDHNEFRDVITSNVNSMIPLQIGHNHHTRASTYTMVDHNLFENVGTQSINSKGNHETYLSNRFIGGSGLISLRSGNNKHVEGNYFLNTVDAIKVFGEGHTIINNVIVDHKRWGIKFELGGYRSGHTLRQQARDVLVAHNTFIDNDVIDHPYGRASLVEIGSYSPVHQYTGAPTDLTFTNNIFVGHSLGDERELIDVNWTYMNLERDNINFNNNTYYATGTVIPGVTGCGANIRNPLLVDEFKLDALSPERDSIPIDSSGCPVDLNGVSILKDFSGTSRDSSPDTGAYEFQNNE